MRIVVKDVYRDALEAQLNRIAEEGKRIVAVAKNREPEGILDSVWTVVYEEEE